MKLTSSIVILLIASGSVAHASLLELNFAGESFSGGVAISGSFLLDPSVPDLRPQPDDALYDDAIVSGEVIWDGLAYSVFTGGVFSSVFVLNDSGSFNDLFAVTATLMDPGGDLFTMFLQFGDSTRTVFSDDSFPVSFDLSQFDVAMPGNFNSTGIFISPPGGGTAFSGGMTFGQLRPLAMPSPSTLWLALGAFVAWQASRRRS